jgi:hypothetical protein
MESNWVRAWCKKGIFKKILEKAKKGQKKIKESSLILGLFKKWRNQIILTILVESS